MKNVDQIVVEIWVLGNDSRVDFLLPSNIPIAEILEEIRRQIELTDASITFDREQACILCETRTHKVLDCTKSLADNGVHNGSSLSIC